MERKTYWACVIYENIKRLDENQKKKGKIGIHFTIGLDGCASFPPTKKNKKPKKNNPFLVVCLLSIHSVV